jgi:hypothetical protein
MVRNSFEVGSLILFLLLTISLFRRRMIPEGLYCALTLALLLNSGTLHGIQRYVLTLFPGFFVLTALLARRRILTISYAVLGAALSLLALSGFVRWMFIG